MKMYSKTTVFVLLFCLAGVSFGDDNYTREEIEDKVASFTRMSNSGTGLLAGGIILDCVGTVLMVVGINKMVNDDDWYSSNDYYNDYDDYPDGYWTMYTGVCGLSFGIIMTVGGSVLHHIGKNKVNEYQSQLDRLSLNISPVSASLTYDF